MRAGSVFTVKIYRLIKRSGMKIGTELKYELGRAGAQIENTFIRVWRVYARKVLDFLAWRVRRFHCVLHALRLGLGVHLDSESEWTPSPSGLGVRVDSESGVPSAGHSGFPSAAHSGFPSADYSGIPSDG